MFCNSVAAVPQANSDAEETAASVATDPLEPLIQEINNSQASTRERRMSIVVVDAEEDELSVDAVGKLNEEEAFLTAANRDHVMEITPQDSMEVRESTSVKRKREEEEEEEEEQMNIVMRNKKQRRTKAQTRTNRREACGSSQPDSLALCSFDSLPNEIKIHIFTFLPMIDLLKKVNQVNKHWNDLARDECLWRSLRCLYFSPLTERSEIKRGLTSLCNIEEEEGNTTATPRDVELHNTWKIQPCWRYQCVGYLKELKGIQQRHHLRLFEEEKSYRQQQLMWGCGGGHSNFIRYALRLLIV